VEFPFKIAKVFFTSSSYINDVGFGRPDPHLEAAMFSEALAWAFISSDSMSSEHSCSVLRSARRLLLPSITKS
jgi:hypothetical protein